MAAIIFLDNDQDVESPITRKNTATRAIEAATGLTGITARLSATDGGTAIDPSLEVTATEAVGMPGTYVATFQGSDLRAHVASLAGTFCFVVFGDGVNVMGSKPVKIQAIRRT